MGKKFFLIFVGILIPLSTAFAAWTDLEINWPPSPMGTDLSTTSDLTVLSKYLYEWGIALGGLAAFIALLIAGFLYLTSVGDPQKLADARGRIIWALAGLVLLFAAWLILNTINPDLTRLRVGEILGASCDTDADCPLDSTCIGDPSPGDGKKEGICVVKVGYEVYRVGAKPYCSYAVVYEKENFITAGGSMAIANFDENTGLGLVGTTDILSVKSFFDDFSYDKKCSIHSGSSTACAAATSTSPITGDIINICHWNGAMSPFCFQDCGLDACGCFVELYDCYDSGIIVPCRGLIGNIQAYSPSLFQYHSETSWACFPPFPADKEVDCVILRKGLYSK